eukprot:2842512-Amphidinium_carterae.3
MKIGEITLIKRPEPYECSAVNRYCVPCGAGFGELFPCMLCENWTHMGCSYGVEGGRVCASHVALLDSGEGLAVIISDPLHRLEGTILRPTRKFGVSSATGQRQRSEPEIKRKVQQQYRRGSGSKWRCSSQYGWWRVWNMSVGVKRQMSGM